MGNGGGWTLACDLSKVTLRDIYVAIGSPSLLAIGNRTEAPSCLVEQAVNASLQQAFLLHQLVGEVMLLGHLEVLGGDPEVVNPTTGDFELLGLGELGSSIQSLEDGPCSLARSNCDSVVKRGSSSNNRRGRSMLVWMTVSTMTRSFW